LSEVAALLVVPPLLRQQIILGFLKKNNNLVKNIFQLKTFYVKIIALNFIKLESGGLNFKRLLNFIKLEIELSISLSTHPSFNEKKNEEKKRKGERTWFGPRQTIGLGLQLRGL
jgi:hypothetical protein